MASQLDLQPASNSENHLIQERRQKLAQRRIQAKVLNESAFPNQFRRDHLAQQVQQQFAQFDKPTLEKLNHVVKVAGRIMRQRGPFIVIQDSSDQVQLYVDKNHLSIEQQESIKNWDLGDIVGVSGPVHKSQRGELYIYIEKAQLLTKSLRPLPDKFHGLQDQESRYRQRYVDLIVNPESREVFRLRTQIISAIRQFLQARDFMEVETPMLQPIPGGATARPFITHHNALDIPMYLRIAPELYLKRLVVGGFERVFEINRNFRNEGLSTRHNPEFTMLEFYWAYADYHDLMDLTELMLRQVAQQVLGKQQLMLTLDEQAITIDLSQPFQRLTMKEAILYYAPEIKPAQLEDLASLRALAEQYRLNIQPSWREGRIVTDLFELIAEAQLLQPTFITEYPAETSPLARRSDSNPTITDRFEFFVGGREIANGFSELNDAEDQAERFRLQALEKEAGDLEAMYYDADYVQALEYGMPPTAGEGIGIDRLVMLLTNSASIRDVLLFPAMRPQQKD